MVVTFAGDPDIELFEKMVTPPGVDNGEPVDTTTMHNVDVETQAPHGLNKVTSAGMVVAYDPLCLTSILARCGVEDDITYHYPDGSQWTDRGWLRSFKPNQVERRKQPDAVCVIESSCTDSNGDEQEPAHVPAP